MSNDLSRDPPVGSRTTIGFTLDDLLAPALEKELAARRWNQTYTVVGLEPVLRPAPDGQSSLGGVRVTIERTP